jgi:hypothetical protein
LANLALNGIPLLLVIKKLLFHLGQQLWVALPTPEARTTKEDSMTLAEGTVDSRSINLIGTDYLWIVAISATISSCLGHQVISFVIGVETQAIKEGEPIASDLDRDLHSKFNVASGFPTHDGPDVCLVEAKDANRNTSAI